MFKRYIHIEGFTNLVCSKGQFAIDVFGNVINNKGEKIEVKENEEGDKVVCVVCWDGEREYRVIDLMVFMFKDLRIPESGYRQIRAFVIDGDKSNTSASNIGYRFNSPVEFPYKANFYYIPGFTSCALSRSGDILNTKTGKLLKWSVAPGRQKGNVRGGYRNVICKFGAVRISLSRHKATLLTFGEYPDNVSDLIINHKNGIPGYDSVDNLEWCTYGENNLHAYMSDLKNQHVRVLVRNVLSGEVKEYYSISNCAEELGYPSDETIRYRLHKSEFGAVFQDGLQFKLKDDSRDWLIPDDPVSAVKKAQHAHPVLVRNCESMSVVEFKSVNAAAKNLGIDGVTIHLRLHTNNKKPLFGYQFKYTSDADPFPSFTKDEYEYSMRETSIEVDCRNLLTGEERTYESTALAASSLGRSTIPSYLREGVQPLYPDGWQIKRRGWIWEEVLNVEEAVYKQTREIVAREEASGKLIIANSARQMGVILKKDPKAIREAALTRGNKIYHGYRLRLGVTDDPWPN